MTNRDDILAAINSLCITYADSLVAHERSRTATTAEAHADQYARSLRAHEVTQENYAALLEMLVDTVPYDVSAEEFLPVQPLPTGEVALHARDDHANSVRLKLTGAQALTVGTHLTAYAAISLDRSGVRVAEALPSLTAGPETPMYPAPTPSPMRATGSAPVVPGAPPPAAMPHAATR
ncbi:hypothetical protein FB565_002959 [Actinoplanes lutulentus]|uniref:Uncharacterized protein n=1 Tax=Actinoplanes lutulentus TaxID=1287878 RepID=A0A327Z5Y2_9ACTN|nr:hypothetical protein [Actinoplanes lutulentus]MBB2943246.1 hypothetical protein [Actinoplanes lutulentus]RAK28307.1 hypothetical protein B0I29_12075 [Actinoplanes lutulentus]